MLCSEMEPRLFEANQSTTTISTSDNVENCRAERSAHLSTQTNNPSFLNWLWFILLAARVSAHNLERTSAL